MAKEINQKVLFLGNGIYRAFHGEIESWNSILNTLFCELLKGKLREMPDCSPILKYEYLHTQVEKNFDSKVANCLKRIYKKPQFLKHCDKINEMIWGHFDTVITTNVDNRLEGIEKSKQWKSTSGRKWKFSTFRQKTASHEDRDLKIHYVHGEISKYRSICFGLAHYLGEYRNHYETTVEQKFMEKVADDSSTIELSSKYITDQFDSDVLPWSYYIYNNPVDIVGFGLDSSEVDIWWILKLRMLKKCRNKVRYIYPSIDENAKKILPLLRAYDMVPVVIPCSEYSKFYELYFKKYAGNNCLKKQLNR